MTTTAASPSAAPVEPVAPRAATALDPFLADPDAPAAPRFDAPPKPGIVRLAIAFLIKSLIGVAACVNPWSSLLAAGWVYRVMRRASLKAWWRCSDLPAQAVSFAAFAAADPATRGDAHWPNWLLQQRGVRSWSARPFNAALAGLWANLVMGVKAMTATFWLTLIPGLLWWFAWRYGWDNSFAKGYEQAAIGPLTGIVGIGLFIALMFYLPMAQARLASTGRWRSILDFALIRAVVRRRFIACLLLAGLYALLGLPVMVLKAAPAFLQQLPDLENMTPAQIDAIALRFNLLGAAVLFACYIPVHVAASRIYARGLLAAVENRSLPVDALDPRERDAMSRLDLLRLGPPPSRHVLVKTAAGTTRLTVRFFCGLAAAALWFAFIAQTYVAQFFVYHDVVTWLNQPLVHLPWFPFAVTP